MSNIMFSRDCKTTFKQGKVFNKLGYVIFVTSNFRLSIGNFIEQWIIDVN